MANIEKINKSLNNIKEILSATDNVLKNPSSSLEIELSKQSSYGKNLAPIFGATGVAGIIAATRVSTLSTDIAAILGATAATAIGLTISGPVGWAIGGVAVLLGGGGAVYKKYKAAKKAQQEKERLKNELIKKQQALINKLKRENELNNNEIRNLKETLSVLEGLLKEMNKKAA